MAGKPGRPRKEDIKNPKGGGRKSKMTPETVAKIETAFALGCTDQEACLFAGIDKSTLYRYQEKNPDFCDKKELLKQTPILKARTEVVEGMKGNPELALKFLERKKKDEFSLRQETQLSGDKENPVYVYAIPEENPEL